MCRKILTLVLICTCVFVISVVVSAQSFGVRGETYSILEPDLIKVMQQRLRTWQQTGRKKSVMMTLRTQAQVQFQRRRGSSLLSIDQVFNKEPS